MKTITDTGTNEISTQAEALLEKLKHSEPELAPADSFDGCGLGLYTELLNDLSHLDENSPAAQAGEFVPTLYELEIIARYWLNIRVDIDLTYFLYGHMGSRESRLSMLAENRIEELREAMGEDYYARFANDFHAEILNRRFAMSGRNRFAEATATSPTVKSVNDELEVVCDQPEECLELSANSTAISPRTFALRLTELEVCHAALVVNAF